VSGSIRVKICGITHVEDARAALEAGADALGFNVFPGSRRHVRMEEIAPWLAGLGGDALRVAVMVNPTMDEIRDARNLFDAIQLHGQESPELCVVASAAGLLWKAFPLTPALDAAAVAPYRADALVIDTSVPGAFGGTGALIDFDEAARFVRAIPDRPVWLSGGLSPSNVAEAVEKVRPYGVDVASGVEAPGNARRKNVERMRAFVAKARRAAAGRPE
jgi:phosphoribosylanthranilate isomerase